MLDLLSLNTQTPPHPDMRGFAAHPQGLDVEGVTFILNQNGAENRTHFFLRTNNGSLFSYLENTVITEFCILVTLTLLSFTGRKMWGVAGRGWVFETSTMIAMNKYFIVWRS